MEGSAKQADGAGLFTTRVVWQLEDGGTATWESRLARKRGVLHVRKAGNEAEPEAGNEEHSLRGTDAVTLTRLRRLNLLVAVAFAIGGALFALGAGVAQFGSATALVSASIYFAGGLFFNTGGYGSLLQSINAPRRDSATGLTLEAPWRWWSYEPMRIDWLSTFLLFIGTLVFGVNLVDSFLQGLSISQVNHLIWAPDLIGCTLFLLSGHFALVEVRHDRFRIRVRRLEWWIVAINQLGSVLFFVSALAAFTLPATGSLVNVNIANWGTLLGALCFSFGGVLQLFERPVST